MNDLKEGLQVHYVKDLEGEHFSATVTRIWNEESGVVDLSVVLSDEITDYRISTIAYSKEFQTNSWHRVEDD